MWRPWHGLTRIDEGGPGRNGGLIGAVFASASGLQVDICPFKVYHTTRERGV